MKSHGRAKAKAKADIQETPTVRTHRRLRTTPQCDLIKRGVQVLDKIVLKFFFTLCPSHVLMAEPCPWTVYACDLFRTSSGPHCIARSHTGGTLSMSTEYEHAEVTRVMVLHMIRLMQVNVQGKKSPNYCFTSRPFS